MRGARPGSERLDTWRGFLEAHDAVVGVLQNELQDSHGLSLPAYAVLLRLAEAPDGRVRLHDLTGDALMTRSGVTRLVDRLEADGLLERQVCPSDRRGAYAALTAEGRRRLRRAAPVHLAGIQRHFAGQLSDEEAAVLDAVTARIRASLPGTRRLPGGCGGTA